MAENNIEQNRIINGITSFDFLIKRINIHAYFCFYQILYKLLKYYNIRL